QPLPDFHHQNFDASNTIHPYKQVSGHHLYQAYLPHPRKAAIHRSTEHFYLVSFTAFGPKTELLIISRRISATSARRIPSSRLITARIPTSERLRRLPIQAFLISRTMANTRDPIAAHVGIRRLKEVERELWSHYVVP
ncbi:hypothetical protein ABVK25_007680, partial [Lepraria finkii]